MGDIGARAAGSVLGLALGDALGSGSPAGSDASAMARNLWLSLIDHDGELAIDDVLARQLDWLARDPPRVDPLARRVLSGWREGLVDPARGYFDQQGPEVSAGNGSVKYCAPLGVAYAYRPERLVELAPAMCALTHWDGRCRTACLAVTLAVAALVRGELAAEAVAAALDAVIKIEGGEELEFLVGEAGRARPINGPDAGFVLFCAGIALQTVAEAASFDEGISHVVSLGGDTDANAALAGALLGAALGRSGLPSARLVGLPALAAIDGEAERLAALI